MDASLGRLLAWSPDGDTLAFFARAGRRHALFLIDAFSGRLVRKHDLDIDQPKGPCFTPDGRAVVTPGLKRGGEHLPRVPPLFPPDGRMIYFSGDPRDASNIYSLNLESGEVLRYTDVQSGNFF